MSNVNFLSQRILGLLEKSRVNGAEYSPVRNIDEFLERKKSAVFLKHDVHYANPEKIVEFARSESEIGVFGTYFFMNFDHPIGTKYLSRTDQKYIMRMIKGLGHEVGLHFDPLPIVRDKSLFMGDVLKNQIREIEGVVGSCVSVNLHGNSKFKLVDKSGNNLIYDLFEEISRQRDFPILNNVEDIEAEILRRSRVRVRDYGISYWGDSWIWSARYNLIATNYVTDNWVGKEEKLAIMLNDSNPCAYGLEPVQTIGSREGSVEARWIDCGTNVQLTTQEIGPRPSVWDETADNFFSQIVPSIPLVMLLHPQFYAV